MRPFSFSVDERKLMNHSFENACQDDPQKEEATGYVIPAKAGIQANSAGNKPGFPKFTDQVQHFLYKVLQWDKSMNSFHWNNVVPLPGIAKPGKQSAKSRQLWIARHRL
jgi:hypothetical protein